MTDLISRETLFKTGKTLFALGALAAPLLASSPVLAQYATSNTAAYDNCERRDDTTQIIGGVLGGVVGGLLGNEIDKGDGTVGTVVGAGLGTYAGARLGNRNCTEYNAPQYQTTQAYRTSYTQPTRTRQYSTQTYRQPAYRTVTQRPVTYPQTHYSTTYSQPSYQPSAYAAPRHYPQSSYSSSASTVGGYYGTSSGQLQIVDPYTGISRTISQAEYDRYYRR